VAAAHLRHHLTPDDLAAYKQLLQVEYQLFQKFGEVAEDRRSALSLVAA
jgi:hypothetical protein